MIEFFFDCSSPWTYLAFHNIQPLATELGVDIDWRPVLVGGIFNAMNPSVYTARDNPVPAKRDYMLKDLRDWSREANLTLVFPPSVFPVNSVKAMRGCIVMAEQGRLVPFATALFEAYWGRNEDISQYSVLDQACVRVGVEPALFFNAIAHATVKDQLKANTEEVMRRGGFGSPTIFVNGDDMYFGNDRLPLIRSAVLRARG